VKASGRHAERFLNSQLTSDVLGLENDDSHQTALVDRSGRVRAFGFLCRRREGFQLLLPAEIAEATVESLEQHVIADDVTLERAEAQPMRLALGAEAVRRLAAEPSDERIPVEILGSRGFVTQEDSDLGLPPFDAEELEARRVLTGLPRWGLEVSTGTQIHETTLIGSAVSFEKGCYLGQETVAKVASGRGAARAPMLLEVIDGPPSVEDLVGASFSSALAEKSGTVISAVSWDDSPFLLAAVARELRVVGRELECHFANGTALSVTTHSLPYLEAPPAVEWARRLEREAVAAFAKDRENEAIDFYERAIAVCPTYADAYEGLGVILGRHRRYPEAIGLMHRLLEVDPESVMAHTNLSLYYNHLGRIADAEREAAEAMHAKMRRETTRQKNDQAQPDQAKSGRADRERRAEMFRQVLELDPDDPLGNFGLGELLLEDGRYGEAVTHLQRALSADPRYSAAILALGRALEGARDLGAAREIYRNGVDIAAAKGDLATANKMQERLAVLESQVPNS
jgi:folate-binding protein YgfZ